MSPTSSPKIQNIELTARNTKHNMVRYERPAVTGGKPYTLRESTKSSVHDLTVTNDNIHKLHNQALSLIMHSLRCAIATTRVLNLGSDDLQFFILFF